MKLRDSAEVQVLLPTLVVGLIVGLAVACATEDAPVVLMTAQLAAMTLVGFPLAWRYGRK